MSEDEQKREATDESAAFDKLVDEALADPALLQCDYSDGSYSRYSISASGRKLLMASPAMTFRLKTLRARVERLEKALKLLIDIPDINFRRSPETEGLIVLKGAVQHAKSALAETKEEA